MKKTISIISAAALFAAVLSSCKKNYTCECCVTVGGNSTCVSETRKLKKKDAKAWCDEAQQNSGSVSTSCKLK